MIDVDRMERQLQSVARRHLRAPKPERAMAARPAPTVPPAIAAASARVLARLRVPAAGPEPAEPAMPRRSRSRLLQLLDDGELLEADRHMADEPIRRERLSWATMRALLDGQEDAARASNCAMHVLAQESRDRDAMDRYWQQRLWVVMTWGTDDEREELAEHCRDRAYRADDLQWTAALALVLAQLEKTGEAGEAFEDAFGRLGRAEESIQLDVATNLVEAAAVLRDAFLGARLHYTLAWIPDRLVTIGEGWICKGAVERYRALGQAAAGLFTEADADFSRAVARHRALGARPLLAQTLHQWGTTLVGRDDDRAAECFGEAGALARRLRLTGLGLD
jgi:tetratricopeptide (TPR) repeat protein